MFDNKKSFYDVLIKESNFLLNKYGLNFVKYDAINSENKDNFRIVLNDNFFSENKIDLCERGVTLCCITSKNILFSILSYLLMMRYIKFSECIFLTNLVNYKSMDLLRDLNVKVLEIGEFNFRDYNIFRVFGIQEYVNSDYVFFVEHDSGIYSPKIWRNEFLDYDYIGAVWRKTVSFYNLDFDSNALVGNAGFSIMSRKFLDVLIKNREFFSIYLDKYSLCDDIFSRSRSCNSMLSSNGIVKAPPELAAVFSFESSVPHNEGLFDIFGFHLTGDKRTAHKYILGSSSGFLMIDCNC